MSLINQVLLDLDQRHALVGNLPSATRSVPARAPTRPALRRTGAWFAAGTGILLATAAVFAWQPIRRVLEAPPVVAQVQPLPIGQVTPQTIAPVVIARNPREIASGPRDATGSLGLDPAGAAAREGNIAPIVPLPTLSMAEQATAPAADAAPTRVEPLPAALSRGSSIEQPSKPAWARAAPGARLRLAEASEARPAPSASPSMPGNEDVRVALAAPTARSFAMPAMRAARPGTAPSVAPAIESRVEKSSRPLSARERAEAEYQRALGLHQQGQTRDAQTAFAAALKEDPGHAAARHALAVALIGEGRFDDAQAVLAEGLKFNPQDSSLATVLARVKAEQQDLPGAIAVLKAALPGGSSITGRVESADARALLATLQQRTGNNLAAIENYGLALRAAPSNGAWWIGLAISFTAEGKPASARDALERARATQSLSPELDQYVDQRLRALAR